MSLRTQLRDTGTSSFQFQHYHVGSYLSCDSIEMHKASIAKFEWPNGSYWAGAKGAKH